MYKNHTQKIIENYLLDLPKSSPHASKVEILPFGIDHWNLPKTPSTQIRDTTTPKVILESIKSSKNQTYAFINEFWPKSSYALNLQLPKQLFKIYLNFLGSKPKDLLTQKWYFGANKINEILIQPQNIDQS